MSTNDPRNPDAVAGATFPTAFRGFDQAEVRRFLERVADHLRAVTGERDALAHQPAPELDEATAAVLLGEEAGRILATAREGAGQIRQRAEEGAARLVQQAQEEAERVRSEAAADAARERSEAAAEAARVREEAAAEAESVREAARDEGRQMVAEARAVRERMLADLARRRDAARLQLEQLRTTRDHVLGAFEEAGETVRQAMTVAWTSVDEAAAAVRATEAELPPEPPDVELPAPTLEGGAAPEAPAQPHDEEPAEPGEPATGGAGGGRAAEAPAAEPGSELEGLVEEAVSGAPEAPAEPGRPAAPADTPEEVPEARGATGEPGGGLEPAGGATAGGPEEGAVAALASASAEELVAVGAGGAAVPAGSGSDAGVDALFSRLGRAAPEAVAAATRTAVEEAASAPLVVEGPDDEAEAVAARDAAVDPLGAALARHLKRALSDEQNEVLDAVRRRPVPGAVHDLLGTQAAHAERYRTVAEDDLWSAAAAGARSVARLDDTQLHGALDRGGVLEAGLDDVTAQLVAPLRERLARDLQQSGGDAVEAASLLRAAYREWKTQRVDELAGHLAAATYGRGAFAAVPDGARIRWVLGPGGTRCPECQPGAESVVRAGQAFPTGSTHPPAHPGCRCLIVRVPG